MTVQNDTIQRADGTGIVLGDVLVPNSVKGCGVLAATITAAALGSSTACNMVKLQSDPTNTTNVIFGGATATGVTQAMVLLPGQSSDWIPCANITMIYAKMASSTGNVNYLAL